MIKFSNLECQKWRRKKKVKNEKDQKELKIQIIVMSIVQIQNWNFGLSKVYVALISWFGHFIGRPDQRTDKSFKG